MTVSFHLKTALANINSLVYPCRVKSSELRRWLAEKGATFEPAKGSHFKVWLNGNQSILPMHNKDLGTGLVKTIKKQLGLK